jgi:arylsulfatase A-like enzyme
MQSVLLAARKAGGDPVQGIHMNRRAFLKTISISGATLLLPVSPWHAAEHKASLGLPNIVYILADDLGYGDVSALNPESKIPTPNIDRLAREGMCFTDAHSGSAVCTPTRYGILTGRYCWRSRLKSGVLMGFDKHLIEDGRLTVASLLKRKGYRTACFGKWHLGMDLPTTNTEKPSAQNIDWTGTIEHGPTARGFDDFYGISASLDMPPYIYIANDRFVGECTTEKTFVRKGPAHQAFEAVDVLPEIQRQAVSYIESQSTETPFFAYVPLTAPHTPVVPSQPFQGRNPLGGYGDFCMQVDAVVGEICQALDRRGLTHNTLVIFASDNGCAPYIGVKDLEKKGHFPSYVYRGYKADIFEGGHRIPYMVRWPARVKAASRSSETLCLTDLMATVAAIVGETLPADAGEDSCNMLPVMLGQTLSRPVREATVHHSINGSFSIRQGPWKLELCPDSGGWSDPKPGTATGLPAEQLYDLSKDIAETTNVVDKHPEVVRRLKALLEKYKKEGRSVRL